MGITYLLSFGIVKKVNKPYPVVLGNFMIFIGIYFVLCLMILPNISLLVVGSAIPINISNQFWEIIALMIGMVIVGAILAKKRSFLLNN